MAASFVRWFLQCIFIVIIFAHLANTQKDSENGGNLFGDLLDGSNNNPAHGTTTTTTELNREHPTTTTAVNRPTTTTTTTKKPKHEGDTTTTTTTRVSGTTTTTTTAVPHVTTTTTTPVPRATTTTTTPAPDTTTTTTTPVPDTTTTTTTPAPATTTTSAEVTTVTEEGLPENNATEAETTTETSDMTDIGETTENSTLEFNETTTETPENVTSSDLFPSNATDTTTSTTETPPITVTPIPVSIKAINTTIGFMKGKKCQEFGIPCYEYLGVPFAKPPLKELRFQEPEPYSYNSFGVLQAIDKRPPCVQWDSVDKKVFGSEDCLYLNIYTMQNPEEEVDEKYAVLALVTGTAFDSNVANQNISQFLKKDIIVVTINYRLGVLGFFSTNDSESPGNYGILDVMMALRWIRENIINFAGDPSRVTLAGHGAGAAVVSHIILSPRAKHLVQPCNGDSRPFSAAITISGSSLCSWSVNRYPTEFASVLADELKCDNSSTRKLMSCIQDTSAENLVIAHQKMATQAIFPISMGPVIDYSLRRNPVIPYEPSTLLQQQPAVPVPLLIGVMKDEAAEWFAEIYDEHKDQIASDSSFIQSNFIPSIVATLGQYEERIDEAMTLLQYGYYKNFNASNLAELTNRTTQMMSDILINSCTDKWAKLFSRQNTVYMYSFSYRGPRTAKIDIIKKLYSSTETSEVGKNLIKAVTFGDDLFYLFGDTQSIKEKEMGDTMIKIWSDFIKKHKPVNGTWTPFKTQTPNYYDIRNSSGILPKTHYRQEYLDFLEYVNNIQPTKNREFAAIFKGTDSHEESTSESKYENAIWVLLAVSLILLLALILTLYFLVRLKKSTTFMTQ